MQMLVEQLNSGKRTNVISDGSRPITLCEPLISQPSFKERRHAEFFDVIDSSLAINTPEEFCTWAKGDLQHIFPHGMLVCGVGQIEQNNARIHHLLSCNFPHEYLEIMQQTSGLAASPVIAQWIKTRRPVLFELAMQKTRTAWLENFRRYGLNNMAAHGQCDMNSHTTSYFSFSQISGRLTSRHASLLEMLVPHLHVALIRALKGAKKESPDRKPRAKLKPGIAELTEREHEILQWLGSGKSNWEIAQVLCISENTIKNHVQRILTKLKVSTRAQAVSKVFSPS
jgi:transcriptional regulator EpsA